jgi:hypothetical protein
LKQEVIEAESQAVLNTLTGHNSQGAFKDGRSAGNGAYAQKVATLKVMAATSLRNYGYPIIL